MYRADRLTSAALMLDLDDNLTFDPEDVDLCDLVLLASEPVVAPDLFTLDPEGA